MTLYMYRNHTAKVQEVSHNTFEVRSLVDGNGRHVVDMTLAHQVRGESTVRSLVEKVVDRKLARRAAFRNSFLGRMVDRVWN